MDPAIEKPGRRARKRERMLLHLAATAADLFESDGYDHVTMEQIAERADVARRTLYNHFPSKESVLAHWVDIELAKDLAHLQADVARRRTFRSRAACVLDASAQWCEAHPDFLRTYLRYRLQTVGGGSVRGGEAMRSDMATTWLRLIAAGQETGELVHDFPAAQLAALFQHLYLGALLRWLNEPGLSLKAEFAAVLDLFVEGARQRAGGVS